jgi:hypothetical protein
MNEWTEDDADGREGRERTMDTYLCECGDARCSDPTRLTRLEYEGIRSDPTRFVRALNHENPEIDTVIAENDRFATIEKSFGAASLIAHASDPRR